MSQIDKWGEDLLDLYRHYDSLTSFQEVSAWVEKAEKILQEAEDIHRKMSQYLTSIRENIAKNESDRKNKSFFKRYFGNRKDEQELDKKCKELISNIEYIDKIKSEVRGKIDGMPKSRNEQVEMLKRLNLKKKELNIKKREVNEGIRQVNASARQARAGWTGVRGGGFIGTAARISRSNITQSKENALRPLEAKRTGLEEKLASLEREELRIKPPFLTP